MVVRVIDEARAVKPAVGAVVTAPDVGPADLSERSGDHPGAIPGDGRDQGMSRLRRGSGGGRMRGVPDMAPGGPVDVLRRFKEQGVIERLDHVVKFDQLECHDRIGVDLGVDGCVVAVNWFAVHTYTPSTSTAMATPSFRCRSR